jgi:hypothetical protein
MCSQKAVLATLVCAALSGCGMPSHSNALIFATNTVIALDVSANPTAGAPNITLGYKRQEAAWVPLLANQGSQDPKDRKAFDCSKPGQTHATGTTPDPHADYSGCVFKGTATNYDSDAYSVMASLQGGADISTNPSSGVTTQTSIGQYFATGLAARYLAQNGGAQLVNTKAAAPAETISPDALIVATNIKTAGTANVKKISDSIRGDTNYSSDLNALLAKAYPGGSPLATYLQSFKTKDALIQYLSSDPPTAADLAAKI